MFKKSYWLLVLIIVAITCIPVFGDGVAFKGINYHSLMPVIENEQRAVIVHNNGIEKLLIAVSLELESEEKALWIFPVTGEPNKVKIDVVDSFPNFKGQDPRREVEKLFSQAFELAIATQLYPMPFMMGNLGVKRAGMSSILGFIESLRVYVKVEKWGVHTEVVSTDSIKALEKYLSSKSVKIDAKQLKVFEDYLSGNYVLVLAWISSKQELLKEFPEYKADSKWSDKKRWPCLFVEFPTDKIFYPLRPTSSYGDKKIPISLTVKGLVKPDTSNTFSRLNIEHFTQKGLPDYTPSELKGDLSDSKMFYTTISAYPKGSELIKDLWLVPYQPRGVILADNIVSLGENKIIFFAFTGSCILFISYLSAGIAGLILFGKWNGYSQVGLWNIFTLIGLYIGTKIIKGTVGQRLNEKGRFPGRWMFIIVFSIFYIVLVCYFTAIINI